jgi:hypothetical protein
MLPLHPTLGVEAYFWHLDTLLLLASSHGATGIYTNMIQYIIKRSIA